MQGFGKGGSFMIAPGINLMPINQSCQIKNCGKTSYKHCDYSLFSKDLAFHGCDRAACIAHLKLEIKVTSDLENYLESYYCVECAPKYKKV